MPSASRTNFSLILAFIYSILLFLIANYLPLITNGLAQMLTWVVYSQIVRGLVAFLGAVVLYVAFIRWPLIPNRRWFIAQLVPFSLLSALLLSRLGDSVNEYIHYPQYATCVLLWHGAIVRLSNRESIEGCILAKLAHRFGPLAVALAISAVLGIAEEGYQFFAPRRRFDLQDLALNMMGVWLGAILVWILANRESGGGQSPTNDVARRADVV